MTAIGVLGALMLVANPLALTVIGAPMVVAAVFGARSFIGRVSIAFGIGASLVATLGAGLLLFRWHYGIANVYQPTIDFMRNPPGPDPLRSPRNDWVVRFTWLYGPPLLMSAYLLFAWVRRVRLDRTELTALGLCACQYAYQWYDQIVRRGDGLEISYYWSFMYPAYGLLLLVAVGRASSGVRNSRLFAAGVLWLALLVFGVPSALRFPTGLGFFTLLLAALGVAVAMARRTVFAAAMVVLGVLGWTQVGAPPYDPRAYHPFNMSPYYDQVYRQAGSPSEQLHAEVVWFEEQMDRVPHDELASFVPAGNQSIIVIAIYAPHVVNRVIERKAAPTHMVVRALSAREPGMPLVIAVLGRPGDVAKATKGLAGVADIGEPVLDVTHSSALRSRLVVYVIDDSDYLPFAWTADVLTRNVGVLDGTVLHVAAADPVGQMTPGPVLPLDAGTYLATLRYSSAAPEGTGVGRFWVAGPEGPTVDATLIGTGGADSTISLMFTVEVDGTIWQFPSERSIAEEVDIQSVTLEEL
ncbi:MAG: hypothetical protein Q7V57_19560 [Actinomycetota bacterium]|nr:hypothetical protein [Actinomycetota bacterium]